METIISIHALREEGDTHTIARVDGRRKFLSTPSARRATQPVLLRRRGAIFLSTPSARRATGRADVGYTGAHISIHALREEGDCQHLSKHRATTEISIHALREEGDALPRSTPSAAA